MNKEEKKAINEFNKLLADFKGLSKLDLWYEIDAEKQNELYNKLYPLLNLIDKQQKEIEELKIQLRTQNGFCYFAHQQIMKNYISKDKIREKIEELKEIADEDNTDIYIKIDTLEELIEEN